MKTLEQISQELDAPIPRSAVSQRSGGGGRSLSYLAGHYVIDRLNKVFGPLNWASKTERLELVHQGEYNGKASVHYIAQVRLVVEAEGKTTEHTCTGYGDGSDNNPGKAHELAVKEAETDALKRAAKNLGQSMGLALYDKDQPNVVDDEAPSGAKPSSAAAPSEAPKSGPRPPAGDGNARPKAPPSERPKLADAPGPSRENILSRINTLSRGILMQKKMTKDEMLAEMKKDYGVDSKEALTDEQAQQFLARLEKTASV